MNPERWQKIERIFSEAVTLAPFVREEFLTDACAGDFHLREEIKSMLAKDLNEEFLSESVFKTGVQLLFETDDLLSDPMFGSYELEKLLGRGGMGSVYLARDRRLDRLVALKVLPTSIIENTKDVERFRQEARTASGISHSNVAHIYEFGEARNRWFLAMEYVEGKNLREMMKSQPLDRREILKIVCQIADALTATHRRGIVHRDIKPENIIVADDGTVKVLDFGLAKPDSPSIEVLNDSSISQSDSSEMLFGTVAYMSPEQIRGEASDARTDLWSLGILLFEMLSRKRPFVSDAGNELPRMILNQRIEIADCPKSFRPLVGKLLEKNPADRYRSAAELSEDLRLLKENLDTGNDSLSVTSRVRSRLTIIGILLIIFFGLSAAGSQIYFSFAPLASKISTYDSIAVLPFVNENNGENDDYLSDGLTESLIGKLSRLSNLSVKSKNSVFRYKGKSIVPQTVGKELSVQAILTGRIREQDNLINLDIDLVDTRTGNQIWTKQYNCQKNELITLQREMERDVFANLNSLTSDADERILGKNYTENPEAYRLYLRGRFHWNKRTAKDLTKAIEYYEQAIAFDRNFALAYAALADTYLITSGYGIHSPRESFPKAKEMALKALEIDDTLAEAHNALSYELCNYEWNIAEAEKEIKLAIKLNPNYPTAHQWYSTAILTATGRFDEAVAEARQAQKLDSVSLSVNTDLGSVLLFARRDDEALEQLKKTVEMDENFGNARAYLCRAYLMKKDFAAAIAECRKGQSLYNDPRPTAYLARVYAEQGERQKALEIVAQLKNPKQEKYVSKYYFAIIYAGLGENDLAFEYLNQAFQEREGRMLLLKFDPLMDKLSADPRFDEIIRRIQSSNNSN